MNAKKTILLLIVLCLCLSGCKASDTSLSQTGLYLNTVITVTIYDTDSNTHRLLAECMALADGYEKLFSRTLKGSDIWNINHSQGKLTTVDEETITLLEEALFYAELSDGLVDPTIGSLSSLWNFGSENQGVIPSSEAIASALSHVNYETIIIEGNQVALSDTNACLDLGFIAKGYIADRIKEYLISQGVTSALINLGGNIASIGGKDKNTGFKIGIQKPFADTGTPALSLTVYDKSLVSSGNYERYFEKNGTLYHHILSTSDGFPADSGLSQVTIISESSMAADALSTLCFILGYEEGFAFIKELPDTEAVFITEDGTIYQTF